VTIFDVPIDALPAEGEVAIVDIGSLTLENGAVIDDVSIAVQRWGELSPNPSRSARQSSWPRSRPGFATPGAWTPKTCIL
jgi:hypothetical protein